MTGTTTLFERVRLAKSYVDLYKKSETGFWMALGRDTPWPNESRPPLASAITNKVPSAFSFFYVHSCLNVYESSDGFIQTENNAFAYSSSDDIRALIASKANKVYFESTVLKGHYSSTKSYRILGLCFNLVPKIPLDNLGQGFHLDSSQVSSYDVSWIKMSSPVSISPKSSHVMQIVREF